MLTSVEADSPQNPEEETPTGNSNATLLVDQRRSHQLNSAAYTLSMHLLIFPH